MNNHNYMFTVFLQPGPDLFPMMEKMIYLGAQYVSRARVNNHGTAVNQ